MVLFQQAVKQRFTLSKKLCEAWQWRQANGALSDMVCRSLLVVLERAGQITLPPVKYLRHNPLANRARPAPLLIDTTPIGGELYDGQGYWLLQKRLSKDRFRWRPEADQPAKKLEAYEAQLLLAAGDVSRVRAAPMWRRVNEPS